MGATAVLEMAAATPPAKKSFMKLITASDMVADLRPLTVPKNLTTVLKETQRPSKWTRPTPSALIYRRHVSREFWVMDLHFVKQINEAE